MTSKKGMYNAFKSVSLSQLQMPTKDRRDIITYWDKRALKST